MRQRGTQQAPTKQYLFTAIVLSQVFTWMKRSVPTISGFEVRTNA